MVKEEGRTRNKTTNVLQMCRYGTKEIWITVHLHNSYGVSHNVIIVCFVCNKSTRTRH